MFQADIEGLMSRHQKVGPVVAAAVDVIGAISANDVQFAEQVAEVRCVVLCILRFANRAGR